MLNKKFIAELEAAGAKKSLKGSNKPQKVGNHCLRLLLSSVFLKLIF